MSGDVTPYVSKITSEHADKPKLIETVSSTVQPSADLVALYSQIPSLYDLDVAEGNQLDVIGQWVGLSRNLTAPLTGVYFALDSATTGFDAGVWQGPYDPSTGIVALPDDYYRLALRARIVNNSWDGTKEHFYALAQDLFGPSGYTYYIEDLGNLTINIGLLGPNTPPPMLTALLNSGALDVKPVTITINSRVAQQGPIFSFDVNSLLFAGFDDAFWAN